MENGTTKYPFERPYSEVRADLDTYVDAVFSCLESEFLVMPKGVGFIDYPVFEQGYEALKHVTNGFTLLDTVTLLGKTFEAPIVILVLRTMLGFTPPEWAYVATLQTGVDVSQGFVRSLDRKIRLSPLSPLSDGKVTVERVKALIETACQLLKEGAPNVSPDKFHRLDKADTKTGMNGVQMLSGMGTPYAMLLYERFLGRPFAGHRDSVSDLVGDSLESAIEDALSKAGVSYRKTKRAEKIPGFDQTPDFIIPSEFNPRIIIEAKITEDDGTARDKATRIQHLGELSMAGQPPDTPKYEVIACIAGRGFGVRCEDMKKILMATRGKVFTLRNLDRLIDCTRLKDYRTK
jgi:hypothetical protein